MNQQRASVPGNEHRSMVVTVVFTQEYANRTGVECVTREYVGLAFMAALEDLLGLSEATGADVMRVDLG